MRFNKKRSATTPVASGGPWRSSRFVPFALFVLLFGCAARGGLSPGAPDTAKEAYVAKRSQGYWTALKGGDYAAAYAFLSPGTRGVESPERYKAVMQSTGIAYRDVKIQSVSCKEAACQVALSITYDHPMIKGVVTAANERWIIEDGEAWLVRQ